VEPSAQRVGWRQAFVASAMTAFCAHAVVAEAAPALTPAADKSAPKAAGAAPHAVAIDAVQFSPQIMVVHVGDTVTWTNKDPFPHTVTSKEGGFDSHDIAPGKTWTFVPRKTGVFPYLCTLHTTMTGTLKVE